MFSISLDANRLKINSNYQSELIRIKLSIYLNPKLDLIDLDWAELKTLFGFIKNVNFEFIRIRNLE